MQLLNSGIGHVEEHLEAKIEKPMLPTVNRNAAWMVVQDLSSHWDVNANYTDTPWQFCSGRELSRRQLRDCAHHLIEAAGVKYHRDLNMDSKIYQLMCTDTGHTYIDNRGSTYALPRGTKAACARIVSARANVDTLLKRQITKYKSHVVSAVEVPWERPGCYRSAGAQSPSPYQLKSIFVHVRACLAICLVTRISAKMSNLGR